MNNLLLLLLIGNSALPQTYSPFVCKERCAFSANQLIRRMNIEGRLNLNSNMYKIEWAYEQCIKACMDSKKK